MSFSCNYSKIDGYLFQPDQSLPREQEERSPDQWAAERARRQSIPREEGLLHPMRRNTVVENL